RALRGRGGAAGRDDRASRARGDEGLLGRTLSWRPRGPLVRGGARWRRPSRPHRHHRDAAWGHPSGSLRAPSAPRGAPRRRRAAREAAPQSLERGGLAADGAHRRGRPSHHSRGERRRRAGGDRPPRTGRGTQRVALQPHGAWPRRRGAALREGPLRLPAQAVHRLSSRRRVAVIVQEVMSENPQSIREDASVAEAIEVLAMADFRHLPVVRGRELVGMLSDRDVRSLMAPRLIDLDGLEALRARYDEDVSELMSADVVRVYPDTDLGEVIDKMLDEK